MKIKYTGTGAGGLFNFFASIFILVGLVCGGAIIGIIWGVTLLVQHFL